jgi:HTH-type transcriptional regulator/antitoxin HigA
MESLKYTIIKTEGQYNEYCNALEELLARDTKILSDENEIELLTLLIEKWDTEHDSFDDLNPVELIQALMEGNNLKPKDLTEIVGLSKGTVSKILNYRKGLSKETIRKLSEYFKVSQEAFNRHYTLVNDVNSHFRNTSLVNTNKELGNAVVG